jgi:FkbM family methyltransferase
MLIPLLKAIRAYEPLNGAVTAGVRGLLSLMDAKSEFVVRHLPRTGYVTSRLPNGRDLRLWSRGDDWVANQIFWRGWEGYEPEVVSVFFRLATEARVTLDVGAHVGYFTLLAALANPSGMVHAFEPLARVRERLERNVALNALTNVHCHGDAVSDRVGTQQFFDVGGAVPSSASLSHEFATRDRHVAAIAEVSVTSLDAFVERAALSRIDLVKIDTEATEPLVLTGFARTLERDHPDLLCEVLPNYGVETKLDAILKPLGYRYYHLAPNGPTSSPEIRGVRGARNYLFTVREDVDVPRRASDRVGAQGSA